MVRKMDLCKTCNKRVSCVDLCLAAEAYVDQDYIKRTEVIMPFHPLPDLVWDSVFYRREYETYKQAILRLHADGLGAARIKYHLSCSRQYIEKVINTTKKGID